MDNPQHYLYLTLFLNIFAHYFLFVSGKPGIIEDCTPRGPTLYDGEQLYSDRLRLREGVKSHAGECCGQLFTDETDLENCKTLIIEEMKVNPINNDMFEKQDAQELVYDEEFKFGELCRSRTDKFLTASNKSLFDINTFSYILPIAVCQFTADSKLAKYIRGADNVNKIKALTKINPVFYYKVEFLEQSDTLLFNDLEIMYENLLDDNFAQFVNRFMEGLQQDRWRYICTIQQLQNIYEDDDYHQIKDNSSWIPNLKGIIEQAAEKYCKSYLDLYSNLVKSQSKKNKTLNI